MFFTPFKIGDLFFLTLVSIYSDKPNLQNYQDSSMGEKSIKLHELILL